VNGKDKSVFREAVSQRGDRLANLLDAVPKIFAGPRRSLVQGDTTTVLVASLVTSAPRSL
jgi:hypothetical protein